MRSIELRRGRGESVESATRRVARKWQGCFYLGTTPPRPMQFSDTTVKRTYYRWLHLDRSDAAFELRYVSRKQFAFSASQLNRVAKALARPDTLCLAAVYRRVFSASRRAPSLDAFYDALPKGAREATRELFRARRALTKATKRAVALWDGGRNG